MKWGTIELSWVLRWLIECCGYQKSKDISGWESKCASYNRGEWEIYIEELHQALIKTKESKELC